MRCASIVLVAFGTFFALVGVICSGVALIMELSTEFLVVGLLVLGGGALLLFFGVRSVRWRPTARELASQKPDDMRTWEFKPVGLVLFVALLAVVGGLGYLVGRDFAALLGLPLFALLSLRQVRRLIFYIDDIPQPSQEEANAEGKADEPSPSADIGGYQGKPNTTGSRPPTP